MAFKIAENKEFMGISLDAIYIRAHIQITLKGDVIVKPMIWSNENAYKDNKPHIKTWMVELTRKYTKQVPSEDGKKMVDEAMVAKETKDICSAYFTMTKIEDFKSTKSLVKDINSKLIEELLDIGFISNKKNVKII